MYVTQLLQDGFDANGNVVAPGGTGDLYNAVRDAAIDQVGLGVPNYTTSRWYIAATSWDTVNGAARMVLYDELGNVTERSVADAITSGLGTHTVSFLGAASNSTTTGQALNGDIAELLIYNTALDTFDTNKVINYLNGKYFGADTVLPVPEPNGVILAGIGSVGCLYRRRCKRA